MLEEIKGVLHKLLFPSLRYWISPREIDSLLLLKVLIIFLNVVALSFDFLYKIKYWRIHIFAWKVFEILKETNSKCTANLAGTSYSCCGHSTLYIYWHWLISNIKRILFLIWHIFGGFWEGKKFADHAKC